MGISVSELCLNSNMVKLILLVWSLCFVLLHAHAQQTDGSLEPYYGTASYYAKKFQGRKTANGERFHHDSLTAAHKSLPFGTIVKVTNRSNGKVIVVRINDRMSPRARHLIDLTKYGAKTLDFVRQGYAEVSLEIIPTLSIIEEMIKLEADSLPPPAP